MKENLWKIAEYAYDRNSDRSQEGQTTRTKANRYYMAPEQINNHSQFTYKADIWALGCILYELATMSIGCPRAKFQTEAEVLAHRRDEMTSQISPNAGGHKTARLIRDILHLDESKRPTAASLLAKLTRLNDSDDNSSSCSSERSHSPTDQITQIASVRSDHPRSNIFIEPPPGNERSRVEVESPVDMTDETSRLRQPLSNDTAERIYRQQIPEVDNAVVTTQDSPRTKKEENEGKIKKFLRKLKPRMI